MSSVISVPIPERDCADVKAKLTRFAPEAQKNMAPEGRANQGDATTENAI
jgi:hypothetical protein